jgi:hypothetical protein
VIYIFFKKVLQGVFLSDKILFVAVNESDSFDTSISLCYISKSELNTSFRKEEAPASHLADAIGLLAGIRKRLIILFS